MNKNVYIVLSPGRTGSHIIYEMLSGFHFTVGGLGNARGVHFTVAGLGNAKGYGYPLNADKITNFSANENLVIHTHDIDVVSKLNLDPAQVTLILSYRQDLFLQAMSVQVSQLTNEWHGKEYSNKTPIPQYVNKTDFLNIIRLIIKWSVGLDLSLPYKSIATVYYEDLVDQGAQHLATLLNLNYNDATVGKVFNKSPYSYKDWVLNWEELYQEYTNIKNVWITS